MTYRYVYLLRSSGQNRNLWVQKLYKFALQFFIPPTISQFFSLLSLARKFSREIARLQNLFLNVAFSKRIWPHFCRPIAKRPQVPLKNARNAVIPWDAAMKFFQASPPLLFFLFKFKRQNLKKIQLGCQIMAKCTDYIRTANEIVLSVQNVSANQPNKL